MSVLSKSSLDRIYAHAIRSYPLECCGFVFADGTVHLGANIQDELNRSNPESYKRNAANGYTLSLADTARLVASMRTDNPVSIIYHSHPDVGAYFSREDHDKALFAGVPIYPVSYLVVDVRDDGVHGSKQYEWDGTQFECRESFQLAEPFQR